MRRLGIIASLFLAFHAMAAPDLKGNEVAYSQSGQFIVTGRHRPPESARKFRYDPSSRRFIGEGPPGVTDPRSQASPSTNATTLLLDPNYLVASAERLRSGFNDILRLNEPYRGRIYIQLLEGAAPESEITFQQIFERPKQTWNIKLAMPAEIDADRVLRVLLQALLFEASHRQAGPGGCEIPRWLSEGLVAHLSERFGDLAVFDQANVVNASYSPTNEAQRLRDRLAPGSCLTLEQLSWPGTLGNQAGIEQTFELSSHALVLELLQLKNGGHCFGQMIRQLPRFENWQFAFLSGFQPHFPSLLDAEKWWAVNSLLLGGQGSFEKWTFAESLQRLDEALRSPIERRDTSEAEGIREDIDVRVLISSLRFEQQKIVLARTISGLFALELRAAPHLVRLVTDYRTTLERYVTDREEARRKDAERYRPSRHEEVVVEAALRRLAVLAVVRQDFNLLLPAESPPPATPAPSLSSAQP